jgi:CheY-like chemotaxis protein
MGTAARSRPEPVIVVVDDEPMVCRLTARMLAEAGYRVLEAHGAAEALALLATLSGSVQLVVSDIAMPQMTGLELAAVIADRWAAVPILLVSGHGAPEPVYAGPFLPKPFTPAALLDAVARLLPTASPVPAGAGRRAHGRVDIQASE